MSARVTKLRIEIEDCVTFAARRLDVTKLDRFRLIRAANPEGG